MEVLITKDFDEFSTSLLTEQPSETKTHDLHICSDNNVVDIKDKNEAIVDQVNGVEEPVAVNTMSKCLDEPKALSDSDFIVQNLLFDMKSDEFNLTNSEDKTNTDCSLQLNNSDSKIPCTDSSTSISLNNPNETQALLDTNETTYLDIHNTFTTNKKRGFSIDEISKDETSQNSQSVSIYSNDYTCFLSEQTDATNNLTPFKRSNSYYFDSPVKKLCTAKQSSEDKINDVPSCSLQSNQNDNKIYTGFTSIQNDLEVDCVQDRYDGSDSGFGSELAEEKNTASLDIAVSTSTASYKNDFTLQQASSFEDLQRTSNEFLSAMEVLKPKFSDSVLDAIPLEVINNYGGAVKGILKHNKPLSYDALMLDEITTVKKPKNINFANVTVFYFPRVQGFTCVPSQVIVLNYLMVNFNIYLKYTVLNLKVICRFLFNSISYNVILS